MSGERWFDSTRADRMGLKLRLGEHPPCKRKAAGSTPASSTDVPEA